MSDAPASGNPFGIEYVIKNIADDVRSIRTEMSAYALKSETAYLAAKIEEFVPRQEIGARMSAYDKTFEEVKKAVEDINKTLKEATSSRVTKEDLNAIRDEFREQYKSGPIAPWILPAIATVLSIVSTLFVVLGVHK